jgi:drug/metabolite transporter (DMT)-like permease
VVVQPIIATNLVFALAIASVLSDQPLGRSEWIAVVVTLVGLIIFFLVGDPTSSSDVNPTRSDWLILVTVVGGGIVGVMVLGLARSGTVRAALFGLGAGGAEALMAVLSKAFADKLSKGVGATFTSWEPYALIIGGIATMIAVQSAYQVGIPTVTLPINSVAEPIIAVIIGLTIFGEHLELGGVRGPFVVFGLTLMAAGVYSLGHSAARAEEAAIEQGQGVVTK